MDARPRRRPGRPRLSTDGPSVPVNLRLPPRQYDAVYAIAARHQVGVNDVIRKAIAIVTKTDRDTSEG